MKINFIIPFTGKTGGIKVIFEYANRLSEKGHDVICYVPMKAYKFDNVGFKGVIKNIKASIGNSIVRGKTVNWFKLKVPIKLVPLINNTFIREADISIATAWPTAYDVNKLNKTKGKKFYLIQHYETWSGPLNKVDNSYKLDLNQIVVAKWLQDLMKDKFNNKAVQLVHNGIDFNEFYNHNKIINNQTVCIMYSKINWKGFEDGIKAFQIVKKQINNLKLIVFGLEKGIDVPEYAEFHLKPNKNELREIYSKSDVFVFPSRFEGWGLTPLEAMACKCAVVGTNTGAVKEIGINGENMLISEPEDINGLANNLLKILKDNDLLERISNNGNNTVLNFSWQKSVDKFEKILMDMGEYKNGM